MKKLIFILALFKTLPSVASTSAVTATITDPDSQTWNNCSWSAVLVSPRGGPTINRVAVTLVAAQGTCSSSGVITTTLTDTSSLDQSGATWKFTLQPNASVAPTIISTAVVGATPNLSTQLSTVPAPRFSPGPNAFGYLDVEVYPTPSVGALYFNVTSGCIKTFTVAGWPSCSSGGANIAHTSLVIKGDNAGNGVPADGHDEALTASTLGTGNVLLGTTNPPKVGNRNVTVGVGAGASLDFGTGSGDTNAGSSVLIGYQAGNAMTNAYSMVAVGQQALLSFTGNGTPVENGLMTAVGSGALQALTSGIDDVAVGEDAGTSTVTANGSTLLGVHSASDISDSEHDVIIGHGAMLGNIPTQSSNTSSNNVVIGQNAAWFSTQNQNNVIIGQQAVNVMSTGSSEVIIGQAVAPQLTTGNENVIIGQNAGPIVVTGSDETFIGTSAGFGTTGSSNVAIGNFAGNDGAGTGNFSWGFSSGGQGGNNNVSMGFQAGNGMTGGANVAIGIAAKNPDASGTGSNNVLIGNTAQTTTNAHDVVQIGTGKNSTTSTAQIFSTLVVNAAGKIPTASLDNPIVTGTLTMTTGTSDTATVTGATGSSKCTFSPTNATAAGSITAYISAVGTNTVTITHLATVANGGTLNILCTTL